MASARLTSRDACDRRERPEQTGSAEGGGHREDDHLNIDPRLVEQRNARRFERRNGPGAKDGEGEPREAAGAGEEQAFDEQPAHEPESCRAQSRAHGEIAASSERHAEHEARNVDARHQEQERDGAEEQPQRRRDPLADDAVSKRRDGNPRGLAGSGSRLGLSQGDRRHLDTRAAEVHAGREPRHGREVVCASLLRQIVDGQRQRRPDLGAERKIEGARHDADDFVRPPVEHEEAADDPRIAAKPPLPQGVAQHDDGHRGRIDIGSHEGPPRGGRCSQNCEERRGHRGAGDLFGARLPLQGVPVVAHGRDVGERRALGAPLAEIGRRYAVRPRQVRSRRIGRRNHHQRGRIGIRQGPPEDGVHGAEDHGRSADAERQRQHGRQRERRTLREHAHGVPSLLRDHVESHRLPPKPRGVLKRGAQPPAEPPSAQPHPARGLRAGVVSELGLPFATPGLAFGRRYDPGQQGEQAVDPVLCGASRDVRSH